MAKFFVLSHNYNDQRSWWEPYFGEQLVEADNMDAMCERLRTDGLYRIFEIAETAEVQVETRKVVDHHVRRNV